jgi:peptide/nickel transport system substrate-binding protein
MKRVTPFLLLAVVLLLGVLAVAPAFAQDDGLIIIEGNFGGDPATFNPILASDTASRRITAFLFPGFINANVETANYSPYDPPLAAGGIVEDWTLDETGTIYTFTLRQGLTWSDGDPIDAADVLYSWNAIKAGAEGIVDTPLSFVIDPTGETGILDVVALDDYTIQVTMASAECTSLGNVGVLYPAPSHVLPEDLTLLNDADFNLNPSVTSGPFSFSALIPGDYVALEGNDSFFDAAGGEVAPAGFIYRVVPDQTVLFEQFLAGETNVVDGPAVSRRAELRALADAGETQVYPFPGNAWDYLGLNQADPSNPQNGLDEDGNPIDQGHHPIFGDQRVRQALALGIDVDSIVDAAVFGEGSRMNSFIIPSSWAYNHDLAPIAFDPEAAAALLEEAGWIDEDGDGVREAHGAMYAEDGAPLSFTLYTNEGNGRRTQTGTLIQDQLAQIGVQVNFQTIDFNTLLDIMDSQTFDAFILGWRNGWPDDPDATQLFTPQSDIVGSGSNNTSYASAEFAELNTLAKNVAGCDPAERAELYYQMQEVFQNDLPYIPLFTIDGMYAAGSDVANFGPYPSNLYWNADTWDLATP